MTLMSESFLTTWDWTPWIQRKRISWAMPQKFVWTCRLCVVGESICVASTLFHPQSSHHTQNKSGTWCQGGTWGVWDEDIYNVTLFLLQRYLARSYCFLKVLSQWTQGRDRWSVPASCAATWDRNLLAIWRKITHCWKVVVKNTKSMNPNIF